MKRLEVSGAVRPIYGSLGVKRLTCTTHANISALKMKTAGLSVGTCIYQTTRRHTPQTAVLRAVSAGYRTSGYTGWYSCFVFGMSGL